MLTFTVPTTFTCTYLLYCCTYLMHITCIFTVLNIHICITHWTTCTKLHIHINYCTLSLKCLAFSWFWYFTWACKVSKPFKKPGKRQTFRPNVHYMYVHIYFTACTYSLLHAYILCMQNVHTYCTSRTFSLWTAVQPGLGPWLLVSENSRRHVGSLGFPGTGQRRVFQKNSSPLQGIPKVSIWLVYVL